MFTACMSFCCWLVYTAAKDLEQLGGCWSTHTATSVMLVHMHMNICMGNVYYGRCNTTYTSMHCSRNQHVTCIHAWCMYIQCIIEGAARQLVYLTTELDAHLFSVFSVHQFPSEDHNYL